MIKEIQNLLKTNLNRLFIADTISIQIGENMYRTWNTQTVKLSGLPKHMKCSFLNKMNMLAMSNV